MTGSPGLIRLFARHRVASAMLMALMVLSGLWALPQLNTQFFPNFELDVVTVRVVWTGASAEDVEASITDPLEQELRTLDHLRRMTSTSGPGVASITMEYEPGTDMGFALEEVRNAVDQVRNLPADAEEPEVSRAIRYDPVARVLVSGTPGLRELRPLIHDMERELLDRGITKVEVRGLPELEMAVTVPTGALLDLQMDLGDIARRIADTSVDLPAGLAGRDEMSTELRGLGQRRSEQAFAALPLRADREGGHLLLGDVAELDLRPRDRQLHIRYEGQPAVELQVLRAETADALESARILDQWVRDARATLPPGLELHVYDEFWSLIAERINLLLKNGLSGLLLVVAILFLFLNGRLGLWVAASIPVAFTAALAVLYLYGGSINMISLFAMIMALGLIVDNAIVVSEHALARFQQGAPPLKAAEEAARRMVPPVVAASLTTVAAFLPLMAVGGVIGNILFDIPLVVICVILATLIIAFLILPARLAASFRRAGEVRDSRLRQSLDRGFERLRNGPFRRLVTVAVRFRGITVSVAVATLILSVGLMAGGRLGFTFFPDPEGTVIHANIGFVSGTPAAKVDAFLNRTLDAARAAEAEFGGGLMVSAVPQRGQTVADGGGASRTGDQFAGIRLELISPDRREVRNDVFIRAWRSHVATAPGLESFSITERQAGPPGRAVEVELAGAEAEQLKAAALELAEVLNDWPGVEEVEDDTPFGRQQLIYEVTPEGRDMGLTTESLGRQLRAAYDGSLAQIYQDGIDEVEVRVRLPDYERGRLASLDRFGVVTPGGGSAPLDAVAELTPRQGFETLRHAQARRAITVMADVDRNVTNPDRVLSALEREVLPELTSRYGIEYHFEGRAADQEETLADMRTGLVVALAMIYIVLAWVFGSYGWPLVVMTAIPFGLIGALVGHWVMGVELTILSLFGLFGLTGIVVNNAIILVSFYQGIRDQGLGIPDAIVEASCQRLRAVLTTSLTTIAALIPLLFETSVQAQFLIPMAISISFGLAFATVLVLIVIPALLSLHESLAHHLRPTVTV